MRRMTTLVAAGLLMLGGPATSAMAHHEHTLTTPGGNEVTFRCEPTHVAGDPTSASPTGKTQSRDLTAVLHPIHNGLHQALRDRAGVDDGELFRMTTTAGACSTPTQ
jgi:hypothetical protein